MTKFWENRKKPYFWAKNPPLWPKMGKLDFFEKIGLRHFLSCMVLHLHAKNQEILMSQSREKLITNERTNEHGLIYRTFTYGRSKKIQTRKIRIFKNFFL